MKSPADSTVNTEKRFNLVMTVSPLNGRQASSGKNKAFFRSLCRSLLLAAFAARSARQVLVEIVVVIARHLQIRLKIVGIGPR